MALAILLALLGRASVSFEDGNAIVNNVVEGGMIEDD